MTFSPHKESRIKKICLCLFSNLWRLVGELDGHLEQPDREVWVDLRGEPDAEVCVHLLRVDDGLHHLVAKVEREVTVLEEDPVSGSQGQLEKGICIFPPFYSS